MIFRRFAGPMALLFLLSASGAAQAKNHLSRDELRVLSVASVAVVYMDTDRALWPYINQHIGVTPATMILADVLNQRELYAFNTRTAPYQSILAKLPLAGSTYKAVQDALASVAPLQRVPWTVVVPDPRDHSFLREQGLKTKAQVVVFIRPRLELNDDADDLYLVTMIDIETLDPNGISLNHYSSTELSTDIDVDDEALPPLAIQPGPLTQKEDARAAKLFADEGAAFEALYAKLLPQAGQKLYYYFTGTDTPPPAAATLVSQVAH